MIGKKESGDGPLGKGERHLIAERAVVHHGQAILDGREYSFVDGDVTLDSGVLKGQLLRASPRDITPITCIVTLINIR